MRVSRDFEKGARIRSFFVVKSALSYLKMSFFRAFSDFEKNFEEISKKGLTFPAGGGTLCVTSGLTHGRAKEKRTIRGDNACYTIK